MVAARYAYSKGKNVARKISAVFAVVFGIFALFFVATPKLWGQRSAGQSFSFVSLFTQNVAHADVPHSGYDGADATGDGDSSSCAADSCAADAACGSDCGGGSCAGADAAGGGCGSDAMG
jgi:hypothetical protein